MKIECMKNLIYTFVGSVTLVLLTSCSAEFEPVHTSYRIASVPFSG